MVHKADRTARLQNPKLWPPRRVDALYHASRNVEAVQHEPARLEVEAVVLPWHSSWVRVRVRVNPRERERDTTIRTPFVSHRLALTRYCYYQHCMVYSIHTGGGRGSCILSNERAMVLYQGRQCRWAGGMKGWVIRAQQSQSKRISCQGQRTGTCRCE